MGVRIHGLRAITLLAAVAVTGLAVPAALLGSGGAEPVTLETASFTPVVIPGGPARAQQVDDVIAQRVPSTEHRDDTAAPAPVDDRPALAESPRDAAKAMVGPKPTPPPVAARPSSGGSGGSSSVSVAASGARARVVQVALAQRNDRYVAGGDGPDAFDCSGLVNYAYNVAGVGSKLEGRSAAAILSWGRSQGIASGSNGRPGDVVIYGNGSHAGIYLGNGRVISALNPSQGIQIHGLHALGSSFTAFIHTRI
ncbi:MAG TPA: NlpC/P60 family protein [Candidatus Limnocylindrales bacterium]|nr:NlpC/P60 family protein [Candidatus Limnocylindrales bacterium]